MIVYFADRKLNILGQASTSLPKGAVIENDEKTEEVDVGVSTFSFTLPFNQTTRNDVEVWAEAGNYLLRNEDDQTGFYTIIDSEINTKNQEVYVYAEDAGLDLLNEVVGSYEADKAYPITKYIELFSYDSGFVVGLNEIPDLSRKLKWEGEQTATARLLSVATQFDNAEISYDFQIDNMEIKKKYINIYKKRGKEVGEELRLNRNVDCIVTKKTVANLATALVATGGTPEGKDAPITLSGYKYDDGDFYVEGTVVKSRKALAKWSRYLYEGGADVGHIVQSYSYDTTSQSELCNRTVSNLKKICDTELNFEVSVAQIPDGVKIGDTVNVVDDEGKLYLSARVLKMVTSASNKKATVTLGNYLLKGSGISQKLEDLAKQFQELAKNRVLYTWIAYADDIYGNGISLIAEGKDYMGTATNQLLKEADISDKNKYVFVRVKGEEGSPGEDGPAGKGIRSYGVKYQVADSGTDVPIGAWSPVVPVVPEGGFLWTQTATMFTDNTEATAYSVAKSGTNGMSGIIVQVDEPVAPDIGQLWQTSDGEPVKRWNGVGWVVHHISAESVNADTLSAITADLGVVTAGVIKNAQNPARVVEFNVDEGYLKTEEVNQDVVYASMKMSDGGLESTYRDEENNSVEVSFEHGNIWLKSGDGNPYIGANLHLFKDDVYIGRGKKFVDETHIGIYKKLKDLEVMSTTVKKMFSLMHPVGHIMMTTTATNPSTIWGGTWVAWGAGRVPVGVNTAEAEFNAVNKTGGAKNQVLTEAQLPNHAHMINVQHSDGPVVGGEESLASGIKVGGRARGYTRSSGSNAAHNNLQPYITCYMWRRTA